MILKFTCEKCGEIFETEYGCRKHEEEHRINDTPAFGDICSSEFTLSLTEFPDEGEGKYTFTYADGRKRTGSGYPSFYSNITNINKLVGKKIRVTCYGEIIE